ncbi:MAG: OmpA family protein, partial [Sphingobacteriales bacterium]
LIDNPSLVIQINGHTDNVGKTADNMMLSNNRAKAVVDFLIKKGISASRLLSKGFGETHPMGDNNTEEGRAKNRRTEVEVIRK